VEKHGFVLTLGRFVGIKDAIDDGVPFEEKMKKLTSTLKEQFAKEELMNAEIKKQLAKIGFSFDI
jgi:type I restriction enzyme M protein